MRSVLSLLRLLVLWDRLRSSYWFLPSLLAAAATALAFAMTQLDAALDRGAYVDIELLHLFGPEGARSILSVIASSMITVAGLTFSITMLTLQLATSQFGPRLLRNFMRDRGNQLVLGIFLGTFIYCLLVLRTVKGVEGASFVPHLAVAIGVLLALASLAMLIYFIHHTAHSIRIETILASLAAETDAAIDRLYPDKVGQGPSDPAVRDLPDFSDGHAVRAKSGGYVQAIDGAQLMDVASRHGLVVHIIARPGSFVTPCDALLLVLPPSELPAGVESELGAALVVGNERTPDQDLDFSVRRIVEIAQRSLSPSVNDPTTALYCIDRLRQTFVRLADRRPPATLRVDGQGCVRVIAEPVPFEELACNAFGAVVRYAGKDSEVVQALASALDQVIGVAGIEGNPKLAALRFAVRRRMRLPAQSQSL
jgi:uncharacterized membrane protein